MTADDFLLIFIAFGGFLIFASVFWAFALVADRARNKKRGPDVRPDPNSPDVSSGQNGPGRSGRANDFYRRFAALAARYQAKHSDVADARTRRCLTGNKQAQIEMLEVLDVLRPPSVR